MVKETKHYVFLVLGCISFAAGAIGLVLPIMPTVPFLIVSAFCFSKSSPRLYKRLISLPKVGPQIQEWEEYGIIRRRSKLFATIGIVVGAVYPLGFGPLSIALKAIFVCVMTGVLIFIWTRPGNKSEAKIKAKK